MLGIDWLKQFGSVTTDYTSFIMRFTHLGQEISLQADVAIGLEPASTAQVKRLIHTGSTSALFHLCVFSNDSTASTVSHLPLVAELVARLLRRYDKLFQSPTHLPPSRDHTVILTLLPTTTPVNVRPYRYPHF